MENTASATVSPRGAKMSAVWRYSKLENEGSATATCKVCKLGISRGGKDRAAFNLLEVEF